MIDERELRIGSLVYPIINGEVIMNPHTIKGITDKSVYIGGINDSDAAEISFDNICSIPLSEEILLKCGFDENMVLSTIEGEIRYYGDGDINIGGEDSCTLGMVYIAKCKYLHQLQNLYFALTGKELKIEF